MWKNLRFRSKVSLLVLVFIIFSIITALGYHKMANEIRDIGIENSSEAMLNGYRTELKDIVDFTAQALASASEGVTNERELYQIYSKYISKSRFFPDESGYIFIFKDGGDTLVHPTQPELEGTNQYDLKDADGKQLIKALNDVAVAGGGFTRYLWDKPGSGNLPKLSYSRMIPDKPYFIGSGIYIDDIEAREKDIHDTISNFSNDFLIKLYGVLAAIFLLVIIPLTIYMIKTIVTPLVSLTETAEEYSRGNLNSEFADTERQDEVGELARSVQRLGRSTKIVMDRLKNS